MTANTVAFFCLVGALLLVAAVVVGRLLLARKRDNEDEEELYEGADEDGAEKVEF